MQEKKIYIAGHDGMVGSALMRKFQSQGCENIVTRTIAELNLTRQKDTEEFFEKEKPEVVIVAAARVGGILANNTYRAEFIYDNLMIEANIIHSAKKYGAEKLIFLGSSCIYPKFAPQPMKEEYLRRIGIHKRTLCHSENKRNQTVRKLLQTIRLEFLFRYAYKSLRTVR